MSVENLKTDLKANTAALAGLTPETATVADIIKHLRGDLWPFLESHVDETAEIDDCVADIMNNAEDILQPETAEVFAAVIAGGEAVAAALRARISREGEPQLWKVVEELTKNCKAGSELLKEIVIDGGDEDDEEDDEEDENDDDNEQDGDTAEGATP